MNPPMYLWSVTYPIALNNSLFSVAAISTDSNSSISKQQLLVGRLTNFSTTKALLWLYTFDDEIDPSLRMAVSTIFVGN